MPHLVVGVLEYFLEVFDSANVALFIETFLHIVQQKGIANCFVLLCFARFSDCVIVNKRLSLAIITSYFVIHLDDLVYLSEDRNVSATNRLALPHFFSLFHTWSFIFVLFDKLI